MTIRAATPFFIPSGVSICKRKQLTVHPGSFCCSQVLLIVSVQKSGSNNSGDVRFEPKLAVFEASWSFISSNANTGACRVDSTPCCRIFSSKPILTLFSISKHHKSTRQNGSRTEKDSHHQPKLDEIHDECAQAAS